MDSTKSEKLLILGKSGSGKDFLMRELVKTGLKPGLKMTTRPQRKYETQGVNYDFVSESLFSEKLLKEEFFCHQTFTVTPDDRPEETWYYGITKEEFQSSQVFIITPGEFSKIDPVTRKGCFVVYLDIPRDVREGRLTKREDKNDSIKRRLDADEIDFSKFSDYDLRITDPEFLAEDVYSLMD